MRNNGNTCYLNSLLQQLLNLDYFSEFLKNVEIKTSDHPERYKAYQISEFFEKLVSLVQSYCLDPNKNNCDQNFETFYELYMEIFGVAFEIV